MNIKKIIAIILLFCVTTFTGCSDKRTLYVYNWADYIEPELIAQFEQKYSCNVVIDNFDDNETMLAKMLSGAGGYDIIFPSTYIIDTFKRHNLIQPINVTQLTNVVNNFDTKYANLMYDNTLRWAIPYAFSMTGICYRKDKITCDAESWDLLLNSNANGRVCILNDIREVIGIGLKYNGFSANSTNINELIIALNTVLRYKDVATKLDNVQYKGGIATEEFYICMGYNSDIMQLVDELPTLPIEFFIPVEGSVCCFDEICITSTAKHLDLVYAFIDFLYDAQNAARNAEYICAAVPNKNIWQYLSEEFKCDPLFNVSSNVLNRLDPIQDVGDKLELYNKIWDKFKSSN